MGPRRGHGATTTWSIVILAACFCSAGLAAVGTGNGAGDSTGRSSARGSVHSGSDPVARSQDASALEARKLMERARQAFRAGEREEARIALQRALKMAPEIATADTWHLLGHLSLAADDADVRAKAPAAIRRALEKSDGDPEVHMALIDAYRQLGMVRDARREYDELLERHPEFARGWLGLGLFRVWQGRDGDALKAFDRVVELRADWAVGHLGRAGALQELLRYDEARNAYERALELDPTLQEAVSGIARCSLALGEPRRVKAAIERIPEGSRSPADELLLGRALLRIGEEDRAVRVLEEVVAEQPGREALTALGRALEATGDPRAAEVLELARGLSRREHAEERERIRAGVESRADTLIVSARTYLEEDRLEDARAAVRRAAVLRPGDPAIARLRTRLGPSARIEAASERETGPSGIGDESPPAAGELESRDAGTDVDVGWPTRFIDVAAAAGLRRQYTSGGLRKLFIVESTGTGAAWLDYERDGRPDLFLPDGHGVEYVPLGETGRTIEVTERPPDTLYRQQLDGSFVDVAATAGVAGDGWAGGAAVGDIDNDGFPDLYVTHYGANLLYRNNGDGTFTRRPGPIDADRGRWSTSAAFADLDADGRLDLYVANYVAFDPEEPLYGGRKLCDFLGVEVLCGPRGMEGQSDLLLFNAGDGTFHESPSTVAGSARFYGLGVLPVDVDGDGDLDLYVANDMTPNLLLVNQGSGGMREEGLLYGLAYSGDGRVQAGMGIAAGDVDGDGLDDLVVTNFSHDTNTVYLSRGGPPFDDATATIGLGSGTTYPYLGWGDALRDLDLDGDLDLFIANGHIFPQVNGGEVGTRYRQPNQLFANQGGRFVHVSSSGGPGLEGIESSRATAVADYDGDGDEDVAITNIDSAPSLLRNDTGPANGWIQVRLVGIRTNRDGIGGRVLVESDRGRQPRTVRRAAGYLGSHDPTLTFGLGNRDRATIEVRWPSGSVDRIEDLAARRLYLIVEGRGVVATEGASDRTGTISSPRTVPWAPRPADIQLQEE